MVFGGGLRPPLFFGRGWRGFGEVEGRGAGNSPFWIRGLGAAGRILAEKKL